MLGKCYKMERASWKDPWTGVEVIRLTDNKGNYDRPYFTSPQVSADGCSTIFVSDFTGTSVIQNPDAPAIGKIGFGELFLLDLETGEARKLTEGEAIKMGHGAHAMLRPDGKKAYYYSNEALKEVDCETLESRMLMRIPACYHFHSLSMGRDPRYLAFSVVEEFPLLTACFTKPGSQETPGSRERYFGEPRSFVFRYDLQKDKAEVVTGGHARLTHVSLHPEDPDRLLYCHDGPWYQVQRMWRADMRADRVEPVIAQQKGLEAIGHEFFTPSGRVGAQYSYRYKPDMPFFQFADLFVNLDGSGQERFYYLYQRTKHVSVGPDETLGVGDVAALSAEMKDPERYLSLIWYRVEDHRAEVSLLCAHDASGSKAAHVHPVFTPDGTRILFSSDRDGQLNIYMVEARKEKALRRL